MPFMILRQDPAPYGSRRQRQRGQYGVYHGGGLCAGQPGRSDELLGHERDRGGLRECGALSDDYLEEVRADMQERGKRV